VTRFALRLAAFLVLVIPSVSAGPSRAQQENAAAPPADATEAAEAAPAAEAPADRPPADAAVETLQGIEATPEQIESLIAALEDETERTELVERLRLLLQVNQPEQEGPLLQEVGVGVLASLSEEIGRLTDQVAQVGGELDDLPELVEWVEFQITSETAHQRWLAILEAAGAVLGAGVAALVLANLLLRHPQRALARRERPTLLDKLLPAFAHLVLDLLPIAAFLLAAYAVFGALSPSRPEARIVCLALINAVAVVNVALAAGRAVLAPGRESLRPIPAGDALAADLYRRLRRIAVVVVVGFVLAETAYSLGLSIELRDGLVTLVGLMVAVGLARTVIAYRKPIARTIRGGGDTTQAVRLLRGRLAAVWHVLAVIYIAALFLIWALAIEGGFRYMSVATLWTIAILVAARWLTVWLHRATRDGISFGAETTAQHPDLQRRANRYVPVLRRILAAVIAIAALLGVLGAWGFATLDWLSGPVGREAVTAAVSIAVVVAGGIFVWEAISLGVERHLSRTDDTGELIEQRARIRTLLPLLRNAVMVVLVVVITLIVLSELGINIAPLLAGAGVIGLAIGFGAQALVQDVITGLFMLFENTISVGDVAVVGNHGGLVESMSIRTVRLRDLSGNVHTVPFSQVSTVMNMTRDFSYYLFDIGVAYREDVDQVIEVVKQLGAELQQDPDYAPVILEPIEILGVDAFKDSAVIIKARMKTKPIKQWMVGREYNRRMKKRFDELGIEIPFPHMTLYFGQDKQGQAAPGNLQVTTPALTEALARGFERPPPAQRSRPRRRKSEEPVEEFKTPDAAGDSPAESTPGHEG
jgi:small conductance mechanosensitive channel